MRRCLGEGHQSGMERGEMSYDGALGGESTNSDPDRQVQHHLRYQQHNHIPLHHDSHREHIPHSMGTGVGVGVGVGAAGTEGLSITHTRPNSFSLNYLSATPSSAHSSRTGTAAPTAGGCQPTLDNMLPAPSNPPNPSLLASQRPRACDSCRGLKVRCQPTDESNPYITCKRCAKASRKCIFMPLGRKMHKKTDTRVDELEKKIEALTATLQATGATKAGSSTPSPSGEEDEGEEGGDEEKSRASVEAPKAATRRIISRAVLGGNFRGEGLVQARDREDQPPRKRGRGQYDEDVTSTDIRSPTPARPSHRTIGTAAASTSAEPKDSKSTAQNSTHEGTGKEQGQEDILDVVDRGLLTMEQATDIFYLYIRQMTPLFPIVVFPPGTAAQEIRKTRPAIFLAILAIASGTVAQDLHTKLNHEIIDTLAERVMCKGEKSLEMIQSLLLVSAWNYTPSQRDGLPFVQLTHMAAVMTIDIGINRRNGHHSGLGSFSDERAPATIIESLLQAYTIRGNTRHPDSGAIESRRTLLACYYCCSAIAMGLRRQNIFRFTSYMADCIEVLETSKDALPSDRVLAQWCRVQRIADEFSMTFLFDDPDANVSIQDLRVQCALRGFKRQFEQFSESAFEPGKFFQEGDCLGRALKLAYHYTVLTTHDIGLHINHHVHGFGLPYTKKMILAPPANDLLIAIHVDLLSQCLTSARTILDIFHTFSTEETRTMPFFTYARAIYAAVILMKLYFSATAPKSELGRVLGKDGLLVDRYINELVKKLEDVAAGGMSRSAERFGRILKLLQSWWEAEQVEMRERGKEDGEDRAKRHKSERHCAGVLGGKLTVNPDGTRGVELASEEPCTPDTAAASLRLPPLQFVASAPASEAPDIPYTSSSASTPSMQGGGHEGVSTPLLTYAGLRQIRSLPSLHSKGPGVSMSSKGVNITSPLGVGRMYPLDPSLPSGQHPPLLPLGIHPPVMYPYPPYPRQQNAQSELHRTSSLHEQNRHFAIASESIVIAAQFPEGVYTSGVPQYGSLSAATSVGISGRSGGGGAYMTSGVTSEKKPFVPGELGYNLQGINLEHAGIPGRDGLGMGVWGGWGGAGFMASDPFWAAMEGSFDET